jgi:hypothetical protein
MSLKKTCSLLFSTLAIIGLFIAFQNCGRSGFIAARNTEISSSQLPNSNIAYNPNMYQIDQVYPNNPSGGSPFDNSKLPTPILMQNEVLKGRTNYILEANSKYLVILGGNDFSGNSFTNGAAYNFETKSWQEILPLGQIESLDQAIATIVDSIVYIFGVSLKIGNSNYNNFIIKYNLVNRSMSALIDMGMQVSSMTSLLAVNDNKIYVFQVGSCPERLCYGGVFTPELLSFNRFSETSASKKFDIDFFGDKRVFWTGSEFLLAGSAIKSGTVFDERVIVFFNPQNNSFRSVDLPSNYRDFNIEAALIGGKLIVGNLEEKIFLDLNSYTWSSPVKISIFESLFLGHSIISKRVFGHSDGIARIFSASGILGYFYLSKFNEQYQSFEIDKTFYAKQSDLSLANYEDRSSRVTWSGKYFITWGKDGGYLFEPTSK